MVGHERLVAPEEDLIKKYAGFISPRHAKFVRVKEKSVISESVDKTVTIAEYSGVSARHIAHFSESQPVRIVIGDGRPGDSYKIQPGCKLTFPPETSYTITIELGQTIVIWDAEV